jgi:hypothetical protein
MQETTTRWWINPSGRFKRLDGGPDLDLAYLEALEDAAEALEKAWRDPYSVTEDAADAALARLADLRQPR